ncbi:hypothetical protein FJ492_14965 [Mesorhizobium sp. B2-5-4]|uniref:hypothetical protein n=1 Tax=Mesorhizobium sp. B2-5-4 TaxID=2589926 RepID=UPI00112D7556|nr:hypothetical protein [Mesorhizobium sp. B2-5-4]TPK43249.1 hypothetical protein FJ492_14965 [Mesorhizobium sp. B2-5-4]
MMILRGWGISVPCLASHQLTGPIVRPKNANRLQAAEPLDGGTSRPARFSLHPRVVSSAMSIIPVSPRLGLFGRVFWWLELGRGADHIKTIGKNAIWVFPVYVALERTV